jgi:hypothetical protein
VSGVVFLSMTPSRPLMNFVADVDESHLYHPRWIKIMKYMMIQNRQQLWSHFEMKKKFSYYCSIVACGLGHVDFLGGWSAAP